jgi:hypothetical protein
MSVTVNKTLWKFPALALDGIAAYLMQHLASDVSIQVNPSAFEVVTPSISVRHSAINPYTDDAAIVAHIQTTTTLTIRTSITAESIDESHDIHESLVAEVMGALIIVDSVTKENALHTEIQAVSPDGVTFSQARWSGSTNGIDDENKHLITRIELQLIISPEVA